VDIFIVVTTLLMVLLAFVPALQALGIDVRLQKRSPLPPEALAFRNPSRKARVALGLSLLSACLSSFAAYHFFRPRLVEKTVEKPVDRIVEKMVPADCPKVPNDAETKGPVKKASNGGALSAAPGTKQPPQTQFCEGGNCAQSTGQTGGVTAGQINIGSPVRHLSESDTQQLKSRLDTFHSKVMIDALVGASDALPFANELQIAMGKAGVSVDDQIRSVAMSSHSKLVYGVQIDFHGSELPLNAPIRYRVDSQLGILASALEAAHINVASMHSDPKLPEDLFKVTVGLNPADQR
jgi:hypothetical protein